MQTMQARLIRLDRILCIFFTLMILDKPMPTSEHLMLRLTGGGPCCATQIQEEKPS